MRKKKDLAELTAFAKKSVVPKYDGAWAILQVRILDFLEEIFQVQRKSVQFDDENQVFYWKERTIVGVVSGTSIKVELTCNFELDPRKDLVHEFQRIESEKNTFSNQKEDLQEEISVWMEEERT